MIVEIKRLKKRLVGIIRDDGHTEFAKTFKEALKICEEKKYILKPDYEVVKE
jgi:hypothetical protein